MAQKRLTRLWCPCNLLLVTTCHEVRFFRLIITIHPFAIDTENTARVWSWARTLFTACQHIRPIAYVTRNRFRKCFVCEAARQREYAVGVNVRKTCERAACEKNTTTYVCMVAAKINCKPVTRMIITNLLYISLASHHIWVWPLYPLHYSPRRNRHHSWEKIHFRET